MTWDPGTLGFLQIQSPQCFTQRALHTPWLISLASKVHTDQIHVTPFSVALLRAGFVGGSTVRLEGGTRMESGHFLFLFSVPVSWCDNTDFFQDCMLVLEPEAAPTRAPVCALSPSASLGPQVCPSYGKGSSGLLAPLCPS